jgi:hypothetical protein
MTPFGGKAAARVFSFLSRTLHRSQFSLAAGTWGWADEVVGADRRAVNRPVQPEKVKSEQHAAGGQQGDDVSGASASRLHGHGRVGVVGASLFDW